MGTLFDRIIQRASSDSAWRSSRESSDQLRRSPDFLDCSVGGNLVPKRGKNALIRAYARRAVLAYATCAFRHLRRRANHNEALAHPASMKRGVRAIVTIREAGMRWTWRHVRRAWPARTEKSCGPGAPRLASSLRCFASRRRRGQERLVPGESTKEAVKTIAQGRPGVSRPNLWFLPRAFFHARGPWVLAKHPVFPAPSRCER
jgi:hypothetical protein